MGEPTFISDQIIEDKGLNLKKVFIHQDNADALQATLGRWQGGAQARVITVEDLLRLATKAEAELAKLSLPKNQRSGARYQFTEGSLAAPSSYGSHPRASSWVEIERGVKHWFVGDIERRTYFPEPELSLRSGPVGAPQA